MRDGIIADRERAQDVISANVSRLLASCVTLRVHQALIRLILTVVRVVLLVLHYLQIPILLIHGPQFIQFLEILLHLERVPVVMRQLL